MHNFWLCVPQVSNNSVDLVNDKFGNPSPPKLGVWYAECFSFHIPNVMNYAIIYHKGFVVLQAVKYFAK
jgi:hypothetical protein